MPEIFFFLSFSKLGCFTDLICKEVVSFSVSNYPDEGIIGKSLNSAFDLTHSAQRM